MPPADFRIETHDGLRVLRDDVLPGGSKSRFVPGLIDGLPHVAYAGPFCGGGAWALAVCGGLVGARVTLFYAKRKVLHRRQLLALKAGAEIRAVPYGYMTNVTAKARAFCEATGARLMPIGYDCPEAVAAYTEEMGRLRAQVGTPEEIWCATGSGLLVRSLGLAFPDAQVNGVVVGLVSHNSKQPLTPNVTLHEVPYKFERECKFPAPFPCDPNYDRKAWELARQRARPGALFWNVAG